MKSQVIISLFETVNLSVSISTRILYNSLNSRKEKNSRNVYSANIFFFRIFTSISDHHRSRSMYAGLTITESLSSFQSLLSNSVKSTQPIKYFKCEMQTALVCLLVGRSMRSLHVYERLTDHACRLRIDLPAGKNNGRNIIVIAMHSNGVAANTQVRCMF